MMSPDKYPAVNPAALRATIRSAAFSHRRRCCQQWKPLLRTHHAAGYECLSGILCYLPEFARHWQTRHLVNVALADGKTHD